MTRKRPGQTKTDICFASRRVRVRVPSSPRRESADQTLLSPLMHYAGEPEESAFGPHLAIAV
jgi:hypothetical protein